MSCIEIENMSYVYFPGTPLETVALQDINLKVRRGEFLALAGATGSGKSTLVRHFNGLLAPTSGRVFVLGGDVADKKYRRELWKRVGLVFQFPERQIFGATVYEDIAFGPRNAGLTGAALEERVYMAASVVELPEEMLHTDPSGLSGGMRRRVAIAGVLAMRPEILVLDEPGAGLEPRARENILAKIKELQRKHGLTVVLVTHQLEDAALYADRLGIMKKGSLMAIGEPAGVLAKTGLLREAGLEPPFAVKLACRLMEEGIKLPRVPVTVEDFAGLLEHILKRGKGKPGGEPR